MGGRKLPNTVHPSSIRNWRARILRGIDWPEEFHIKLIRFMDKLLEKYVEEFDTSYQKAANRLVREFTQEFCFENSIIDWEKLVEFNSGK